MGILSRMSTIVKAKMSKVLDAVEDPRETLDYSYERQLELLQKVKRSLADVVTAKKQLELQVTKLEAQVKTLEDEARQAVAAGRDDLAQAALERKAALQSQVESLRSQLEGLRQEEEKVSEAEKRLTLKIEAFRAQKEVVKAQYTSAEAQVKIGEAATGISEELADVGLALERAQEKTERMKARASAIDELVSRGDLADPLEQKDSLSRELDQIKRSQQVAADLERLKAEVGRKEASP